MNSIWPIWLVWISQPFLIHTVETVQKFPKGISIKFTENELHPDTNLVLFTDFWSTDWFNLTFKHQNAFQETFLILNFDKFRKMRMRHSQNYAILWDTITNSQETSNIFEQNGRVVFFIKQKYSCWSNIELTNFVLNQWKHKAYLICH